MRVLACITMLMLAGCAGYRALQPAQWQYPRHKSCGVIVCKSRVGKIDPRDCYCSHKSGSQILDEMRQ